MRKFYVSALTAASLLFSTAVMAAEGYLVTKKLDEYCVEGSRISTVISQIDHARDIHEKEIAKFLEFLSTSHGEDKDFLRNASYCDMRSVMEYHSAASSDADSRKPTFLLDSVTFEEPSRTQKVFLKKFDKDEFTQVDFPTQTSYSLYARWDGRRLFILWIGRGDDSKAIIEILMKKDFF